jgi:ferrous iron transport protein B
MFGLYMLGIVLAPLIALLLKRTLLRGETPIFVMEMPLYKVPSPRLVLRRMYDSGWAFLRRAGTIILASMIVVWALLYFPSTNAEGESYPALIAELEKPVKEEKKELEELQKNLEKDRKELKRWDRQVASESQRAELQEKVKTTEEQIKPLKEVVDPVDDRVNELKAEWNKNSLLGRAGQAIEPVVRPLGWDWRIGVAALASFPAREVVVGTLGIIYKLGKVDSDEIRESENAGATELGTKIKEARWNDDPEAERVFSVPVALSLMVFFALCCQCASTLAVIRRETNSWRWPVFTFVYMTVLAYVGALLVYQVGSLFG